MKFSVETWAPEYGVAVDGAQLEESDAQVDTDLEIASADWAPITPDLAGAPDSIVFVDGVRRIDARIWISDGALVRQGVCATVAAGAVRCTPGRAEVTQTEVWRGVFTGPTDAAADVQTKHGTYHYFACKGEAPDELYLGIHEQMTALETQLQIEGDVDLIVFDGPMRGRNDPRGVGYIKTQHVHYLPEPLQPVMGQLGEGQRTPLFHIGGGGGFNRYSWYLRLPGKPSHPLAGIVRCELPSIGSVAEAVDRANAVTGLLPRYASEEHKDGRAPQNLYPIAGLERQLRDRLGDSLLMERALRIASRR